MRNSFSTINDDLLGLFTATLKYEFKEAKAGESFRVIAAGYDTYRVVMRGVDISLPKRLFF